VGYVGSQGHRLLATHDINLECADLHRQQNISDIHKRARTCLGSRLCVWPFFADSLSPACRLIPAGSRYTCRTARFPQSVLVIRISIWSLARYSSPFASHHRVGCPSDGVPVFPASSPQTQSRTRVQLVASSLRKEWAHGLQCRVGLHLQQVHRQRLQLESILRPILRPL